VILFNSIILSGIAPHPALFRHAPVARSQLLNAIHSEAQVDFWQPIHTPISLLYLFLYSTGESPVIRLNTSLNAFASAYPTSYITSLSVLWLFSVARFDDSTVPRCEYSSGVTSVALIHLLSKVLRPAASHDDSPSMEVPSFALCSIFSSARLTNSSSCCL